MPLLDSVETRARQPEVGLRRADARIRRSENVVSLFDLEHDVLHGAIECEVGGDQLLARAALGRAARPKSSRS